MKVLDLKHFVGLLGQLENSRNDSKEALEKLNSKIHCLDQEGIQQFVFLGLPIGEQQEKSKYLARSRPLTHSELQKKLSSLKYKYFQN